MDDRDRAVLDARARAVLAERAAIAKAETMQRQVQLWRQPAGSSVSTSSTARSWTTTRS